MYITFLVILFLQVGFEYLPEPSEIGKEYNAGGVLMMKSENFISINETPVKIDKSTLEIVDTLNKPIEYDDLPVPSIIRLQIEKEKKHFVVKKILFVRSVTATDRGLEGVEEEEIEEEKLEKVPYPFK